MSSMAYEQTCHPIQWVPLLCWLFNLLYLCTSRFFAPQHWNKTVWVMSCSCCNLQVRFFWLRTVPPNLHLKKLNPNIDLSNFACCIPDWWGGAMHETNRRTGDAKVWNFSIFFTENVKFLKFKGPTDFQFCWSKSLHCVLKCFQSSPSLACLHWFTWHGLLVSEDVLHICHSCQRS